MLYGEKSSRAMWQSYCGPNLGYVREQFERYAKDPDSVAPEYREWFERWGEPPAFEKETGTRPGPDASTNDADYIRKVSAAIRLLDRIRDNGHFAANVNPMADREHAERNKPVELGRLDPESNGIGMAELESIPAGLLPNAPKGVSNGREACEMLRACYLGTTGYEFGHLPEEEREWLTERVEVLPPPRMTASEKEALWSRLVQAEQLESFLHRTFVGQKRFSLEGGESLIPMLDEIAASAATVDGARLFIGMAHRGRLNVLAHIGGKSYSRLFAEFRSSDSEGRGEAPEVSKAHPRPDGGGDVKYHLGAEHTVRLGDGRFVTMTIANNPSHLEFVNPVVQGLTRAAQEERSGPGEPVRDVRRAAAVWIHGDAAFAGEGIVPESLNLISLPGYRVGGTVHIIVNNGVGFTTDAGDARSTRYSSDVAKGFGIPVVHVNADDPEACLSAVRLGWHYRCRFGKDFLIDLIGYRRYGHNEGDDPSMTQPVLYAHIRHHPSVSVLYGSKLEAEGVASKESLDGLRQEARRRLEAAYDEMKAGESAAPAEPATRTAEAAASPPSQRPAALPKAKLLELNRRLLDRPDGFRVHPKLERILERRGRAFEEEGRTDWALAETLAFAAIAAEGIPVRLSGQDSQRGTFAHRHLVLHDADTGETYCPIHRLADASSFAVWNSPLSEAAALGFEYGYSVQASGTFVLWEAQYGDFANAAQVIIDQFIAAGAAKWGQRSGLALLLPHGYEGQGPEHSSARLERYLQLAAEGNWTVAQPTKASQYFHLLRLQAASIAAGQAKPLIVMTPKSLIRHPRTASSVDELTGGEFRPVLEPVRTGEELAAVERLIVCSGKAAVELEEAMDGGLPHEERRRLHLIRLERLYPFPDEEVGAIVRKLAGLKEIVWVQEEPKNMGAWTFAEPKLREMAGNGPTVRYVGRPERASTATGYAAAHADEQKRLVSEALTFHAAECAR